MEKDNVSSHTKKIFMNILNRLKTIYWHIKDCYGYFFFKTLYINSKLLKLFL